jgi:glucan biosynthesis protein
MHTQPPGRRSFLLGLSSLFTLIAARRAPHAQTVSQTISPSAPVSYPFSHANVVAEAKARPFVLPSTVPQALGKLTYDLYRQIRLRKDRAV